MARQSFDEVRKVQAEIAQVIDNYAKAGTQARQNADDLSARTHDVKKGPAKTRKSA